MAAGCRASIFMNAQESSIFIKGLTDFSEFIIRTDPVKPSCVNDLIMLVIDGDRVKISSRFERDIGFQKIGISMGTPSKRGFCPPEILCALLVSAMVEKTLAPRFSNPCPLPRASLPKKFHGVLLEAA